MRAFWRMAWVVSTLFPRMAVGFWRDADKERRDDRGDEVMAAALYVASVLTACYSAAMYVAGVWLIVRGVR